VGTAAFALTAGTAWDEGGFHAVAWDRALVGLAVLAFAAVVLDGAPRPGRHTAALLAALAFLTAWTAASWLWSDSPPAALDEAQRVALYLAAALAVAIAGRRVPPAWLAGGVAAGVVPVAGWNLAVRLAPDWTGQAPQRADIGSLAAPVGYANGLALLVVLALLLALGFAAAAPAAPVRAAAAVLLVPFAADLALQQSAGAEAALAAGLVALVLVAPRGRAVRSLALLAVPLAAALAVGREGSVVSPPVQDLTAAAGPGHRLLLGLALLAVAQLAAAIFVAPRLARSGRPLPARAAAVIAALLLAAGLVAAPFALRGHERGSYWSVAAHEYRADPVLGSGAGTFVDWWLRTRTTAHSTQEAHSLYVETLAELGPAGLLAVLVALGAPLVAALRLRAGALGPALLAALVAFDVHAAVDFDWELAGVTLPAVLLGAAAAVHADPERGRLRARPRRAAAVALAGLTAAALLALAGSSHLAAASTAEAAGRFDAAVAEARGALRYAPWSADAWRVIGESRLAQGDRAGARDAFQSAVRLDPNDWQAWAELAGTSSTGEPRRAAEAEAARLNPLGGGR
jgi:tetratricopeptide (TPR) repeat protein